MDQLQEALNTFNVHNKQQTETNTQKPHSNVCNSTHKSTKQNEENVIKDDLLALFMTYFTICVQFLSSQH